MKVLVGIPTRKRLVDTNKLLSILKPHIDCLLISSQGSKVIFPDTGAPVVIAERPEDGLCAQRNFINEWGIDRGFDIVVQIDDDLDFKVRCFVHLLIILEQFPQIGFAAAPSRVTENWNKDLVTNQEWMMDSKFTQFFAYRVSTALELMRLYNAPLFHPALDGQEDEACSFRAWSAGFPIVRSHGNMEYAHNVTIARNSKVGDSVGGLSQEAILKDKQGTYEYMKRFAKPGGILSSISMGDGFKISKRYNWAEMSRRSIARNGLIEYEDSKGRTL